MTRIGVTYQGSSELPEAVSEALGVLGDVITIPTNDDLPARLHHEALDIVFGMAGRGDEIARRLQVAAFLDYYAIPYVGGDAVAQATCLQRARMKETLSYHGVATTAFTLIDSEEQLAPLARRAFPVTVLPARPLIVDGASQVAYDYDELRLYVRAQLVAAPDESVLIEDMLPGDSFSCALLGNGRDLALHPIVPQGEQATSANNSITISDEHRALSRRARLDEGLTESIQSIVFRAWTALGCRDVARIDVQLNDAGVPYVTSVDPLPPMAFDDADITMRTAMSVAGLDEQEVLQRCLLIAAKRAQVSIVAASDFRRLPRRTPPGVVHIALQR